MIPATDLTRNMIEMIEETETVVIGIATVVTVVTEDVQDPHITDPHAATMNKTHTRPVETTAQENVKTDTPPGGMTETGIEAIGTPDAATMTALLGVIVTSLMIEEEAEDVTATAATVIVADEKTVTSSPPRLVQEVVAKLAHLPKRENLPPISPISFQSLIASGG